MSAFTRKHSYDTCNKFVSFYRVEVKKLSPLLRFKCALGVTDNTATIINTRPITSPIVSSISPPSIRQYLNGPCILLFQLMPEHKDVLSLLLLQYLTSIVNVLSLWTLFNWNVIKHYLIDDLCRLVSRFVCLNLSKNEILSWEPSEEKVNNVLGIAKD